MLHREEATAPAVGTAMAPEPLGPATPTEAARVAVAPVGAATVEGARHVPPPLTPTAEAELQPAGAEGVEEVTVRPSVQHRHDYTTEPLVPQEETFLRCLCVRWLSQVGPCGDWQLCSLPSLSPTPTLWVTLHWARISCSVHKCQALLELPAG